MTSRTWSVVVGMLLLAARQGTGAEDPSVYFSVPVAEWEITAGERPVEPAADDQVTLWRCLHRPPRIVLDGPGDAYVALVDADNRQVKMHPVPGGRWRLLAAVPQRGDVQGTGYWPQPDGTSRRFRFRLPAAASASPARSVVLQARSAHYERLWQRNLPGSAWFRHQLVAAQRELGQADVRASSPRASGWASADRTLDFLSGAQAVHENLQLDTQLGLPLHAPEPTELIDIAQLRGIDVREVDWASMRYERDAPRDVLASFVPADQHAVFFPSFAALSATFAALDEPSAPLLRMLPSGGAERQIRARYERQLGVSLSIAARLLGPTLVESVAITGGDPYFVSGTDLAVLLESKTPAALQQAILAQLALLTHGGAPVPAIRGERNGVTYTGRVSNDRRVSSYVTQLERCVVVTNSLAQLQRIIDVSQGKSTPLSDLPEYAFFRDRYRRGADDEAALLIISDPTIRRWCGPRWRVATGRRLRAAAWLAECQAQRLDDFVAGRVADGPWTGEVPADVGPISVEHGRLRSARYGEADLQTPIQELELPQVTAAEAAAYGVWRDGYQQYWRRFFDPIAVRLALRPRELSFDLTVFPLIDQSLYLPLVELSRGAVLNARSGEPHAGTLLHLALAIQPDADSSMMKFIRMVLQTNSEHDPRRWLGKSAALYVEEDPLWQELAALPEDQALEALRRASWPVALHLEITDQARFAGVRERMQELVMVYTGGRWETAEYRGVTYHRYVPAEQRVNGFPILPWKLYSLAHADQWLISTNEPLLKRAIDRALDRPPPDKAETPPAPATAPAASTPRRWLGDQLAVELQGFDAPSVIGLAGVGYSLRMREASWENLPILNEWRQRYPTEDPAALHARLWGTPLACPGGQGYRWNAELQSFESVAFGHPEQPRLTRVTPPLLRDLERLGLGITFENQGIRARGTWQRRGP